MNEHIWEHDESNGKVESVVESLVDRFAPEKIILFSKKLGLSGKTASFKLCLILETDNKDRVTAQVYLTIDSPVPYDVIIYTPAEWNRLIGEHDSFACRINQTGVVLYGN